MPVILDNPIINAYQAAVQFRQQKENTKFEQEMKKKESDRAEEQLQGYLSHLKAEHTHQTAQLDLERQRVETERAMHELSATQQVGQMISSGMYRPGQGPAPTNVQDTSTIQQQQIPQQAGPTDLSNLPTTQQQIQPGITATPGVPSAPIKIGNTTINPDDFARPDQVLAAHLNSLRQTGKIAAETAGQTAGAESAAKDPFLAADETRKAGIATEAAKQENTFKLGQIGAEGSNRLAETRERNKGGIIEANIHAKAATDSQRIRMFGGVDDPGEWNKIVSPYRYGEAAKPLGNTPRDSIVRQHIGDGIPGSVEVTPAMATSLKNNIGLNNIYKEMETIIDKLPSSKVDAFGQHYISKVSGTDAQNTMDQLQGMYLDALKNKNEFAARAVKTEMGAISGLLGGGPGKTKEQAKKNLQLGRRLSSEQLLDSTFGSAPEAQKLDTLLHYHMDPSVYTTKGPDGKTYPRYTQNPNKPGEWGVFNPKTLQYDTIGKE